MIWKKARRAFALSLSALTLGSLLAAPITARADDGNKGKGKKGDSGTIRIDPPIIVPDPTPPPPPPKKEKK